LTLDLSNPSGFSKSSLDTFSLGLLDNVEQPHPTIAIPFQEVHLLIYP